MQDASRWDAAALQTPQFWESLCPVLTLPGQRSAAPPSPLPAPPHFLESLATHGFARLTAAQLWGAEALPALRTTLLSKLSDGIDALLAAGLPPLFILAFDEAWQVQDAIGALLGSELPRHVPLQDWAVFNVPSDGSSSGWPPHRDRPSRSGAESLDAKCALPLYVTCWVPLTPATPETSTLYFLPRGADAGFDAVLPPGRCPLAAACTRPEHFQALVCLPATPGSLLCFGSRTLHYGSTPLPPVPSAPRRAPRQALSFAFAAPDFEASCLQPGVGSGGSGSVPLRVRLALASAQAILYAHQAPLAAGIAKPLLELFEAGAEAFDAAYVARVVAAGQWQAFRQASAEKAMGATGSPSAAEVNIMFAAQAAAELGLDATAYL